MRTSIVALAAAFPLLLTGCFGSGGNPPTPPTPAPDYGTNVIYVANSGNNTVSVIDLQSLKILDTIAVGNEPVALTQCVSSNNDVYVANKMSGTVSVIDDTTDKVVQTIAVGKNPSSLICGSDEVVVANSGDGTLSVIAMATNTVSETDTLGTHMPYLLLNNMLTVGTLGDVLSANSDNTITVLVPYKHFAIDQTITAKGKITGLKGNSVGWLTGSAYYTASNSTQNLFVTLSGGFGDSYYENSELNLPHMPLGGLASAHSNGSFANLLTVDSNDNKVTQLSYDPSSGITVGQDFAVGRTPVDAVSDASQTFVANSGDDTISVLVSTTGVLKQTIALPSGAIPIKVMYGYNKKFEAASPTPAPTSTPIITPTTAPTTAPSTLGNLYVANYGAQNVFEYGLPVAAGAKPSTTLSDASGGPYGIAEDPQHGLIAVEDDGGHVNIYKTPLSAASTPTATITLAAASSGMLAFDVNGNLYVANGTANVVKYSPPFSSGSTPANTFGVGDHTMGVAFDIGGTMYVSNYGSGNIEAVSLPAGTVSATVTPPASTSVGGVIVYNNKLYAVDESNNAVVVYNLPLTSGATPAAAYKVSGMPQAIAFDADGEMLLSNVAGGSVDFYDPPFAATMTPSFSLTGLTAPEQLIIGP